MRGLFVKTSSMGTACLKLLNANIQGVSRTEKRSEMESLKQTRVMSSKDCKTSGLKECLSLEPLMLLSILIFDKKCHTQDHRLLRLTIRRGISQDSCKTPTEALRA